MEAWSLCDGRWQAGDAPAASARWFHVTGDAEGELGRLAERFALHPLAIEDCRSPELHRPKVNDFDAHVFAVLLTVRTGADGHPELEELDAFLGPDFLVTFSDSEVAEVNDLAADLRMGVGTRPGADGLLYELVDRVVDGIAPDLHGVETRLDEIEDAILKTAGPQREHSAEIIELRGRLGHVRRLLAPQLNVIQRFSRENEFQQEGLVHPANRVYFRDVYDHLARVDISLEGVREDAEMVLSTYLSAVNNRVSEVMKVLSVVAALALPATVIAGIFGTNFDNVPGLHSNWGFAFMIAAMAALAGSMAWYFKRRGWW